MTLIQYISIVIGSCTILVFAVRYVMMARKRLEVEEIIDFTYEAFGKLDKMNSDLTNETFEQLFKIAGKYREFEEYYRATSNQDPRSRFLTMVTSIFAEFNISDIVQMRPRILRKFRIIELMLRDGGFTESAVG